MKKVFLVVPSLAIGGQEKVAIDTARCLSESYDIKMIVFHKHDIEYECPCDVVYLDSKATKNVIARMIHQIVRCVKLSNLRRKEKPDIVYSFGQTANLTNALSHVASGKTIIAIHSFGGVRKTLLNTFIFSKADAIICIAKAMGFRFNSIYPKINNVKVIENGYDIDKIIEESKEEFQLKTDVVNFIAVGRLNAVKGYDRLIKAFSIVSSKMPNIKLTFVGKGQLEDELKQLTKELEIEEKVEFAGFQNNPYRIMSKSDVFVLSSHREGFPNALIEALACGLAVVSVDCNSGPREILSNDFCDIPIRDVVKADYGILTEFDTDEQTLINMLARGMQMFVMDRTLLEYYKSKATKRAEEYSLSKYQEKLYRLFGALQNE